MTNKEITSLALKVFAIYVFIQTITLLAQTGYAITNLTLEGFKWLLVPPLLSIIGMAVIFYFLWKLADSVMDEVSKEVKASDDYKIDKTFILNILGFYLIASGFSGVAQSGISLFYTNFYHASEFGTSYNPEMIWQTTFLLIANTVKIIFGVTLLFKSTVWLKLFNKLRTVGLTSMS